MGCDIHVHIERKLDKKWHWVYEGVKNWSGTLNAFDLNRNYSLFAILANVRNDNIYVDRGEPFIPIAMSKGLPSDVSPEVKKFSEEWGCDGHSHSYLTLKEIEDFDWEQKTTRRGYVSKEHYIKFKEQKNIDDLWVSGDIGGAKIVKISNAEMDRRIHENDWDDFEYVTQIEWEVVYKDDAGWGWRHLRWDLQSLSQDETMENVRIVFWFDN